MDLFEKEFNDRFKKISQKYRGVRQEDLEEMNPEYSCVICKNFKICGKLGCSCYEAIKATEEEFASNYEFS